MFSKYLSIIVLVFLTAALVKNVVAEEAKDEQRMRVVSYSEWEQLRQEYLPNILVVDLWAMWCSSCIERFPEMVKLHQQYQNHNVSFVSLNLDDRNDGESLRIANKFLASMKANFDHYHLDEELMNAFEKIDLLGIPAVLIYGKDGNERYRLTGDNPNKQFTEADIENAIKHLINID